MAPSLTGTFDLQPALIGELVRLRPLAVDDFEALYAVAADPLIWEQHPLNTRYRREVFTDFFREAIDTGGALIAFDTRTNQVIGSSRYYAYAPKSSQIAIGYTFLARSHWGHRYNREMKRMMTDHAFQFVETVIFHIGENNWRSRKAIEKIGAELLGPEPSSPTNAGSTIVHLIYRLRRPLT